MLVLWATARPDVDPGELERAALEEIGRLRDVSDDDVTRAIHLLETHHLGELQRVDERADMLSMFTCLFDDPDRINRELDHIRSVTPDRVREFARRSLGTENRGVLLYVPQEGADS